MQFLMLVYTDEALLQELPQAEFDSLMRGCLEHADELRASGNVLDSQQLESPASGRTLRVRGGRSTIVDGPFAETKEMLAGFNVLEAESLDEAMRIAQEFPWSRFGSVEVRPMRSLDLVRLQVGAGPARAGAGESG
jgi:hypothetical protein